MHDVDSIREGRGHPKSIIVVNYYIVIINKSIRGTWGSLGLLLKGVLSRLILRVEKSLMCAE